MSAAENMGLIVPEFSPKDYDFTLTPAVRRLPRNNPNRNFFQRLIDSMKRTVFVTTEDYYFLIPGTNMVGWIPKGFRTDFSSIPRFLQFLPGMSPTGPTSWGAPPHDWFYRHGWLFDCFGNIVLRGAGKDRADRIMLDLNLQNEDYKIIANIAYTVLKYFGDVAWQKGRRNNPHGSLDLFGEYIDV